MIRDRLVEHLCFVRAYDFCLIIWLHWYLGLTFIILIEARERIVVVALVFRLILTYLTIVDWRSYKGIFGGDIISCYVTISTCNSI